MVAGFLDGGDEEDRTLDLTDANGFGNAICGAFRLFSALSSGKRMVLCPLVPDVPACPGNLCGIHCGQEQASPEYPARLDWYLWFDHNSVCRVRQRLSTPGQRKACYAIIKDKAAAPLNAHLRDGHWEYMLPVQP